MSLKYIRRPPWGHQAARQALASPKSQVPASPKSQVPSQKSQVLQSAVHQSCNLQSTSPAGLQSADLLIC